MQAQQIAKLYAAGIRAALEDHEIAQLREGDCVANDFMDANMVLHDAWISVMGYDLLDREGGPSEDDCAIWNEAIVMGGGMI